ncbi:carbohydrate-binding protein [Algibacillus agarilyticus]|uniref:carbohydrate-binding protein n=1 Tax=Algibacillus agarilyticus TaxID=2234133 RepID=UPI000DD0D825|nr:carbohydrate-binding protein [Algibacillus agarilyticus]
MNNRNKQGLKYSALNVTLSSLFLLGMANSAQAESVRLQAESFVASGGTFADGNANPINVYSVNGAQAINYINSGDYVEYDLAVTTAGIYSVEYFIGTNVASGSAIELFMYENGAWQSQGQTTVPAAGWDNFQALSLTNEISLPAGTSRIKLVGAGNNDWQWNLESVLFSLESADDNDDDEGNNPVVGTIKVEAESFVSQGGTYNDQQQTPVTTYNVAGQGAINYINAGDFTDYAVAVSEAGMYQVTFNVGTAITNNSAIEILVKEAGQWVSYAQASVPAFGWDDFRPITATAIVKLPAGNQQVRIHASGSNAWQWNLESFSLVWQQDITDGPVQDLDADNDGVIDANDQCANTPANASVNANGCALSQLDSDNDGVNDEIDQCNATPAGTSVDNTGCALPSGNIIDVNTADPTLPSFVSFNDNTPQGKKWQKVNNLSDEFDVWDSSKWIKTNWNYGGTPVNMLNQNSGVENGNLWIRATLNENNPDQWFETSRVRSNAKIKFPMYTESRIKVANISAYSTFWLNNGDINNRDEIDIIEINPVPTCNCQPDYPWKMNSQYFITKNGVTERHHGNSDNRTDLSDGNTLQGVLWTEEYHVFGAWWKDAHTVQFYLNGEPVNKVNTQQAFTLEQHIIWDLWTQNSSWVGGLPQKSDLLNDNNNIMKVDWIRTWSLVNE